MEGFIIFMYIFTAIISFCVHLFLCGSFSGFAVEKGYESTKYFLICFFFGILGYVWVAGLPDLRLQQRVFSLEHQVERLVEQLTAQQPADSPRDTANIPVSITNQTGHDTWICAHCNTANSTNYGQCKKCGKFRS